MTEHLKFSEDLVHALEKTVCEYDEKAQDPGVFMQYLGITIGYSLSQLNIGKQTKHEFLHQLYGFTQHVFEDMSAHHTEQQEDAFGIWRPGD